MKVLIAVDSFKGTLSSKEVASIISGKLRKKDMICKEIPIADGGEGTVDALIHATNGKKINIRVENPVGEIIDSYYGVSKDGTIAYIEMALSAGLTLIDENEKNPLYTSTFGFGETIKHAIESGVKKVILGIGGSSTNDGGAGMLKALGVKFFDKYQKEIDSLNGYTIGLVEDFDISNINTKIKDVEIEVACDVTNQLLGKSGCASVYSKQKGANDQIQQILEENMIKFSGIIEKKLGDSFKDYPGSGAAGGLGFGLLAFLKASLKNGLNIVANLTELEKNIIKSDVIITGEGSFDSQSLCGKAPVSIARIAKKYEKKVIGIFGVSSIKSCEGLIDNIFSVVPTVATIEQSLNNPVYYLDKLLDTIEI